MVVGVIVVVVVGVVVVVAVVGGIVVVVAMWCLCRATSVVVVVARWCLCRAMSELPGGVTPHPYGSITHQDVCFAHYILVKQWLADALPDGSGEK